MRIFRNWIAGLARSFRRRPPPDYGPPPDVPQGRGERSVDEIEAEYARLLGRDPPPKPSRPDDRSRRARGRR